MSVADGGEPGATPAAPAARRLLRYARWQLADYLLERGISTAVLGAVVLLSPVLLGGAAARASAPALLAASVPNLGVLGTLFALNGLTSIDRQRGYFRFVFTKPVRVERYYAQDFAIRFAALLAVAALLVALFAALTRSAFAGWAVAHVALTFALLGGLGFLLSALTRHDGVALVAVYVATSLARAAGLSGPASALLPPLHLLDDARDAFAAGTAPPVGDLVWLLAYGLGCFAAGLVVLRHRPLSS